MVDAPDKILENHWHRIMPKFLIFLDPKYRVVFIFTYLFIYLNFRKIGGYVHTPTG